MADYNWNERHIITFPEDKLALATKDLHVYYGQKEAIKGIDMQLKKIKSQPLSVHQDVGNQPSYAV